MSAPVRAGRVRSLAGIPSHVLLTIVCFGVAALYFSMANLKGIGTDEGFRLGIINGGREFSSTEGGTRATWQEVVRANSPYAYQPLYFILQNSVMRITHTHNELVLKFVNVCFLWLSLQGLLALSRGWKLAPRLFLVGLFSLNSYLLMHVLQVREYIVGITFYIWSTWLVLRLAHRELGHSWKDTAWFGAYGVLLTIGFYTQSWVVFPAIGQGIFLVLRRAGDRLKFYLHLSVSYVIVLACTWPYLQTHRQKVDVGQWGTDGIALWPQLADGLRLILSGLPAESSIWREISLWVWLTLIAIGAALLLPKKIRLCEVAGGRRYTQQSLLVLLCIAVTTAFQIVYFLKVDTLSVWPRYFAVHYFFAIWLVALAFNRLSDLSDSPDISRPVRVSFRAITCGAFVVMLIGGLRQVQNYHRQPYFDSGLSATANWRTISTGLAAVLREGDVVVTQDFIHSWSLSFTRDWPNPIRPEGNLGPGPFPEIKRFLYLWPKGNPTKHDEIVGHFSRLGFGQAEEQPLIYGEASQAVDGWVVLVFERR